MSHRSNTEDANRADPVTYWIQGRAWCQTCGSFGVYVARVDVADLRCPCDGVRIPDARQEADGEGES